MKLFFGSQAGFTNIFYDVFRHIKASNNDIDDSIFFVSDSDYFYGRKINKLFEKNNSIQLLKEWNFTSKKNISLEENRYNFLKHKYKDLNLWDAIICDRRLMFGGNAKFTQNYNSRYSNEQLINIIYHTIDKIDSILSSTDDMCIITPIPACYYDYLLYFGAKVNKKQYLQLKFSKIENRIFFSPFFNGTCPPALSDAYQKNLANGINVLYKDEVNKYLKKASKEKPLYEGVVLESKSWLNYIKVFKSDLFGGVIKKFLIPKLRLRLSDPHVPPFYSDFISKYIIKPFRKNNIKYITRKRTVTLEEMKQFEAYFYPMHSEPEIAISVYGKDWQNQIELIRKISQSIPLGAKLVIKEHPRSLGYRSLSYYRALLKIPNVCFISPSTSTRDVINNSELVFVLSGFVGFEAILLKKPVISFGDIMYSCISDLMIRKCTNTSRLSQSINDMISNYEYSEHSLKSYISAVYENTVGIDFYSSLLGKKGRHSVGSDNSYEKHIKLLSKVIYSKLS